MSTKEARTRAELWNNQEINPLTDENCELDLNTITSVATEWSTANGHERHYAFKSNDPGDIGYTRSNINSFKGSYFKKATIGGYEGLLILPVRFTNATRANIREKKVELEVDNNCNVAFIDKDKNIFIYEYLYYFRRTSDKSHTWIAKNNVTMGSNFNVLQKSKYLINLLKDIYGDDLRYKDWYNVSHSLEDEFEHTISCNPLKTVGVKYVAQQYNVSRFLEQKKKKPTSEATIKKNKKIEETAKGIVSGELMEAIVNELNRKENPDYHKHFILMRPTEKGIGMLKFQRETHEKESDYKLDSITLFEKNKTPMYVEVGEDGTYKREKFLTDSYAANNKFVVIDNNMTGPAKYVKDFISTNFEKQNKLNVDGLTFYSGNSTWSDPATKNYMAYIRHLFCDKNGLLEKVLKIINQEQRSLIQKENGDISVVFGCLPENVKSNNLNQLLGINKYQLDTNTDDTVKFIKYIMGKTDISGIDKETWDELKKLFNKSEFCISANKMTSNSYGCQNGWYFRRIISSLRDLSGETRDAEISITDIKRILRITEKTTKTGESYCTGASFNSRTLGDYLANLVSIKRRSEEDFETFPIIPSNASELNELHTRSNILIARLREMSDKEADKRLRNKYQKLKKERKDMEMENDEYMIICPNGPEDLRVEGRVQGICIGGYVENYARESTKLFLLRKKSEPETPFFAIEVNNNGVVVQCHGKYNRWLGHNDDSFAAVTFVVEWLIKNNFICNKRILTNQSGSYSLSGCCRSLPDNEIIKKALKDKLITM